MVPGSRGQGFGRRRGMWHGKGRNATMARVMFGWIKLQGQSRDITDRTVAYQPTVDNMSPAEELTQLKQKAESIQSQLNEISTRFPAIEKTSGTFFAHIDDAICTGCGRCTSICPQDAITLINHGAQVNRYKCTGCGICLPECPSGAIDLME